jgi:hypothetical protein
VYMHGRLFLKKHDNRGNRKCVPLLARSERKHVNNGHMTGRPLLLLLGLFDLYFENNFQSCYASDRPDRPTNTKQELEIRDLQEWLTTSTIQRSASGRTAGPFGREAFPNNFNSCFRIWLNTQTPSS